MLLMDAFLEQNGRFFHHCLENRDTRDVGCEVRETRPLLAIKHYSVLVFSVFYTLPEIQIMFYLNETRARTNPLNKQTAQWVLNRTDAQTPQMHSDTERVT